MSTDLVPIVAEINREHGEACRAAQSALAHARRAGELLAQVKTGLSHGEWLPWLAAHCSTIPERTAQAYMRVARRWPELEAKAQRVTDLSVRQALTLLTESHPDESDDRPFGHIGRQLDMLTGLIAALAHLENRGTRQQRRAAASERARLIKNMDRCGWGDTARDLVTYVAEIPGLGRVQCEAFFRCIYQKMCDQRVAELAG